MARYMRRPRSTRAASMRLAAQQAPGATLPRSPRIRHGVKPAHTIVRIRLGFGRAQAKFSRFRPRLTQSWPIQAELGPNLAEVGQALCPNVTDSEAELWPRFSGWNLLSNAGGCRPRCSSGSRAPAPGRIRPSGHLGRLRATSADVRPSFEGVLSESSANTCTLEWATALGDLSATALARSRPHLRAESYRSL